MAEVSSFELYMKYPLFLQDVARDVRLSGDELAPAVNAGPNVWAFWGLAALSGDERVPYFPPNDARQWGVPFFANEGEMRGEQVVDFRKGELTERVRSMYASKNPAARERFARFSRHVAAWTFIVGGAIGITSEAWRNIMPVAPQTLISSNTAGQLHVGFTGDSDTRHPVDGPAANIMSFGPGLTGAIQAGALIGHTKTIHFVSGGIGAEFVNSWNDINMQAMRAGLEDARRTGNMPGGIVTSFDPKTAQAPETRYYADGIASTLNSFDPRTPLDVVLMSSVHTAGVEECHAGVRGAAKFLRSGGLFVLKAPDTSLGTEAGMDRVAEYAAANLGEPVAQGPCGELQQQFDPELPLDRAASFAIYQKQ